VPTIDIFPNEVRDIVPPLNSQEGVTDPIVHVKFFSPDSNWRWYVTEGSPEDDDFLFFGFVVGLEEEWGHFSLSELAEASAPWERRVERDPHFQPDCFSQIIAREHRVKALREE